MNHTNRTHLSLDPEHRARLVNLSKRTGKPMTTVVEDALDEYDTKACACDGRGITGWHAGNWIYCTCRLGLEFAMTELSDKLDILADDLQTMPISELNAASRERKEFLFKQLQTEHDDLEREWERITE